MSMISLDGEERLLKIVNCVPATGSECEVEGCNLPMHFRVELYGARRSFYNMCFPCLGELHRKDKVFKDDVL